MHDNRLEGTRLRLRPKVGTALHLPIDEFFTSLAEEAGPHAVGVILSGTGADGTRGARVIHGAGGFLSAQDPEDARFDGMPRSVIATGLVDTVLPGEQIGDQLMDLVRRPASADPLDPAEPPSLQPLASPDDAMTEIHELLLQSSGIDFRRYKQGTVRRRFERRMGVRHATEFGAYLRILQTDAA